MFLQLPSSSALKLKQWLSPKYRKECTLDGRPVIARYIDMARESGSTSSSSPSNASTKTAEKSVEPLYSLQVFNWILLVYSFLYCAFYILGFISALLAYYNQAEMLLFTVVFILNLGNMAAIICFLVAMKKRKMFLVRAYLGLNGFTLLVEFGALVYVYGFGGMAHNFVMHAVFP